MHEKIAQNPSEKPEMAETIPLPHGLNAILIPRCPICGQAAEMITYLDACTVCTQLVEAGHPIAIELVAQPTHDRR